MHPSNSAMTARTRGWFHPLLALAAALPAVADAVPATRPLAVPLAFEENRGQSAAEVDFLARGAGYGLFLAGGEAVFVFAKQQPGAQACTLRLRFEGARPAAPARGELPQAGRSHYLSLDGSRPPLADVPRVGRVRYSALLPGTDLLFYGRDGRLEYDLELAPGRSAHPPVLRIEGAGRLSLREDGALAIDACGSEVAFEAPVSYQLAASGRVPVESRYRLLGGDRATFELGAHRADLPLVIDPVFSYSTCLAGSGDEEANDVALASSGEVYIVGTTTSADFPTRNPIHGYGGGQEVFITKLNATGTDVVYSTYAGANADHQVAEGVAVNSAGEAFVSGTIYPADGAPWQAFLLKLNAAGNGVAFSRVFGGSSYDQATEVALDSSGNAVVVGTTDSSDFPLLNALQTSPGGNSDGFVRRYSTTGTLLSSTYFGGTWDQRIESVVVGPGDNIWVAGRTDVVDFSGDAFVAKLNSTASSQVYNRRFGGAGQDWGLDLAVDAGSRAYLVGRTASADFPVANAIQPNFGGDHDGFLTVLDSAGSSSFVTSTYLGNSDFETAEGVALGPSGEVYATGSDGAGSAAAFLLKLGNTFNSVVYSVQIQPTGYSETGNAVRVDGSGAAYLVGKSYGGQYFPTTPGAYQACMNGGLNAFAAKIVDGTPQLTVSDVSVTEGNSGTVNARFTVSVDRPPLKAVTFSWATSDGSATSPADFQSSWGSGFSIGAGKTSATVDIQVNADTLDEPNETFSFDLSAVVGATVVDSHAVGTILDDDDPPALSIGDATVTEGNSGSTSATFTVSLSAASGKTVTVAYATANGSAVAPADYAAGSGTLTFNPGQTSTTFAIAVAGDALDEINETFSVNLSSASNATIADGAGLGTILDDDAPPALSVDNGGCSVTEGNSGSTNCNFVLRLSAASGKTVSFSTASANGSAASGSDYTGHGATARSIAAGQTTLTVAVPVLGDTLDEDNESFTLNVSGVANATPASLSATGTISDDDNPPVLSVDNGGCSVTEGNSGSSNCNFVLRLSAVSSKTVNFSTATANGSATSGSDYTGHGATARSIAAGQTTLTVAVPVLGDTLDEANESFSLNVSGVAYATPTSLSASGSIIDDDDAPALPQVSIEPASVIEGDVGDVPASFRVRLDPPATATVTVGWSTSEETATEAIDYRAGSGTLTFAPGESEKFIVVQVIGDTQVEPDEFFIVGLDSAINAELDDSKTAGSILDDDLPAPQPGVVSLQAAQISISENDGSVALAVLRSGGSDGPATVRVRSADGSASAPADYAAVDAVLAWAAGDATTREVLLTPVAADGEEADETFTLTLIEVTGATLGVPSQATVTLLDGQRRVFGNGFE